MIDETDFDDTPWQEIGYRAITTEEQIQNLNEGLAAYRKGYYAAQLRGFKDGAQTALDMGVMGSAAVMVFPPCVNVVTPLVALASAVIVAYKMVTNVGAYEMDNINLFMQNSKLAAKLYDQGIEVGSTKQLRIT